jgi:4'-phosphopantetheinyl transferase
MAARSSGFCRSSSAGNTRVHAGAAATVPRGCFRAGARDNRTVPKLDHVPGDCHVWWASLADHEQWHEQLLSQAERQRRDQYLRAADRTRFTLGVALTRLVLAARLRTAPAELTIDRTCGRCGGGHGRPRLVASATLDFLANPDFPDTLDFSVSHSGDLVGLTVVGGPAGAAGIASVGLDVERVTGLAGQPVPDIALSPAEHARFTGLSADDQACAFLRYWVRKEAVLKATGDGLTVPMSQLTVSAPDQPPRLERWPQRPALPSAVSLHDLAARPGYVASVALLGGDAVVTERDAAALLGGSLCWPAASQGGP